MDSQPKFKFLFDTNIVIPLEPTSIADIEENSESIFGILREIINGNHSVFIHPESIRELMGDRDHTRVELRKKLIKKYPILITPPSVPTDWNLIFGVQNKNSHDYVDLQLLSALQESAVDFLITNDIGLHKNGKKVGLDSRVITSGEAISILSSLFPTRPVDFPPVEFVKAYRIDGGDSIFDSFKLDYPNFDKWLEKCKKEHRDVFIIRNRKKKYGAISIIKDENTGEHGLTGKVLKICSFKVSSRSRGVKYGELLLKSIFEYAFENKFHNLYVEAYPKQKSLIILLEDFGFKNIKSSNKGEYVLVKQLKPMAIDYKKSSFEFHKDFGPKHFKTKSVESYIVPIQPQYHQILFPESEIQYPLFPGEFPFGNSIKKAYLSNAGIRKIKSGDIIYFYLSQSLKALTIIGIVENLYISNDPMKIARIVGKRTVYTFSQIEGLCNNREVLAIQFRQAAIIKNPIKLNKLITNNVLKNAPQTIVTINSEEAKIWLLNQIPV